MCYNVLIKLITMRFRALYGTANGAFSKFVHGGCFMLELLSPAGSPESVVAAVQSGADAVYLGLGGFNARQGAKNFTEEEFLSAVQYCHERGCKVYVTLNTLCSDRELTELAALAGFISSAGTDAVIVQDLGVARVVRSVCPDLPIHASTQMSVHNLAGVHAAAQMGVTRVVLARELSIDQIRIIAGRAPIEVEVFVHGAFCFCHSGQCYMSALIGRRSGNRGMCAQPCRMQYSMSRRADDYPLSLKDNCLVQYLDELDRAGVKCIKIEGRMKRPEYTAIVTDIYHRAAHEGVQPTEKDMEKLRLAFSRDGFTDGYYTGRKQDMHGIRSDSDKDAAKLFSEARKAYATGEMRRVDVDFSIALRAGVPAALTATDAEGVSVCVAGPVPEPAQTAGLTLSSVSAQLYKTGGTPYRCRRAVGEIEPGLFLPAAAINELRRSVLDALTQKRAAAPARRTGRFPALSLPSARPRHPVLNVQVVSREQLSPELAETQPANVYVPLQILSESPEAVQPFLDAGCGVAAVLPRVITDTETEGVASMLRKVRDSGFDQALVGNLGHIALARAAGFAVRGDFGLNAFNSHTLQVLADAGLLSATASFELRLAQVRDLIKCLDTELIIYGRLPAMVSDQCIISHSAGTCACQAPATLSDRMGSVFPVMKEFGCRNVIYNAHKLFLADKIEDVLSCGLWAGRLLFTTETARECVLVTRAYQGQSDYRPNGLTRGLYYRGVE